MKSMRKSTLSTLGLGSFIEIFEKGKLPVDPENLIEKVFGPKNDRGCLVISGASGIVGAGKAMQLGSRLTPYGIPVIALDLPGATDNIAKQYEGLAKAFGKKGADAIMANIVRMSYDGASLPKQLALFKPRLLIEAIPEILELKKNHYLVFREAYPEIEILSVTSGFPARELGVGIAHPAYPHEINKVWEMVEKQPSNLTSLLFALGLVPIPVGDRWSFALDVLFCGLIQAGLKFHRATNTPFWKIDKLIRRALGPNPFRAHDAIGAKGANFLTWSCLDHLSKEYGPLFRPTDELVEHKNSGQNWYPQDHFRPLVDWKLDPEAERTFETYILGAMFQMVSMMVYENRSHFAQLNIIGEICAQFRRGILAIAREMGSEKVLETVAQYHKIDPEAAKQTWYPAVYERMDGVDWQQLYVNAEHNGKIGAISLGREAYNHDVDLELNRAIDWLKDQGIARIVLSGDFHLTTQFVGADTSEFFPALGDVEAGEHLAADWSRTARRLNDEFEVSVGLINGKRCLGGMLELMTHCHYLVAYDTATLGMPEVTLPVVPGMEGCHWPLRKARKEDRSKIVEMLLAGKSLKAKDTVGWLCDFAGIEEEAIRTAWKMAGEGEKSFSKRQLDCGKLQGLSIDIVLTDSDNPDLLEGRKAIAACIEASVAVDLDRAIDIQARHSANFMVSKSCQRGRVGSEAARVLNV